MKNIPLNRYLLLIRRINNVLVKVKLTNSAVYFTPSHVLKHSVHSTDKTYLFLFIYVGQAFNTKHSHCQTVKGGSGSPLPEECSPPTFFPGTMGFGHLLTSPATEIGRISISSGTECYWTLRSLWSFSPLERKKFRTISLNFYEEERLTDLPLTYVDLWSYLFSKPTMNKCKTSWILYIQVHQYMYERKSVTISLSVFGSYFCIFFALNGRTTYTQT